MTPDERMERAAERFADTVNANIEARVRHALALEHDRIYAEVAELRDEVVSLAHHTTTLAQLVSRHVGHSSELARAVEIAERLHSVKVPDAE